MWLVAVSTGTAGRKRRRRRRRRNKKKGRGRTRPEGERFSWPVTPVPVLLFSSQLLFGWSHDSLPWPGLHRVSHATTLSHSLSLCLSLSSLVTKSEVGECNHMRYLSVQVCVFMTFCVLFETVTRPISHQPLLSSQRCLATICPPERENKNQRMLENALKCSNEYFRHKGPLSQPPFAWLSPPNSPFKVK